MVQLLLEEVPTLPQHVRQLIELDVPTASDAASEWARHGSDESSQHQNADAAPLIHTKPLMSHGRDVFDSTYDLPVEANSIVNSFNDYQDLASNTDPWFIVNNDLPLDPQLGDFDVDIGFNIQQ